MPKLPVVSGLRVVKALSRIGYVIDRQHGSHLILKHNGYNRTVTVPVHKELDKGTLRAIIRQSGMTVEEFLKLLE